MVTLHQVHTYSYLISRQIILEESNLLPNMYLDKNQSGKFGREIMTFLHLYCKFLKLFRIYFLMSIMHQSLGLKGLNVANRQPGCVFCILFAN